MGGVFCLLSPLIGLPVRAAFFINFSQKGGVMDELIDRYLAQLLKEAAEARRTGNDQLSQEKMDEFNLKLEWWQSLNGGVSDNKSFLEEFEYS
jgi:hypothetical protein